jgi:hypothetical protein
MRPAFKSEDLQNGHSTQSEAEIALRESTRSTVPDPLRQRVRIETDTRETKHVYGTSSLANLSGHGVIELAAAGCMPRTVRLRLGERKVVC